VRPLIYLGRTIVASDSDILNNTRLSSIPYSGGALTLLCLANLNNATNNYKVTVQLPDGSVPIDSQDVVGGQEVEGALGGQLDSRLMMQFSWPAPQGGHFTIAFTETGAAVLTWAVVLRP